jgi:hypothetical protein
MANDVLTVLRGQLAEAEDQVRRLATAIAALAGAGFGGGGRRGRARKAASDETVSQRTRKGGRPENATGTMARNGRKKRTFSAATRARMAAAQKARWAKRKAGGK